MAPPPPPPPPKKRKRWLRWLLISIVILLLLGVATVVGVRLIASNSTSFALRANTAKAIADVNTLKTSIIRYKTNMNSIPSSLEDLTRRPANARGPWRKMIEEGALKDAWGQPYQYRNPGRHNPDSYDIFSKGPDMKEDTEDDIGNWQD